MFFYYFIFFVLLGLSYVAKGQSKFVFWTSIAILVMISGFRDYSIGTDTPTYKAIFNYNEQKEVLWSLTNQIVKSAGGNYTSLLLTASAFTMIPLGIAMRRASVNPQYSLFFYYALFGYLNSFNGMRQFVAISFVLLAFTYFPQNKIKCFILILIASGFHYTAIVAFAIYLSPCLKLNRSTAYVFSILTLIVGSLINDSVFNILLGRYSSYLKSDAFGYRDNLAIAFAMTALMNILFIWVYNLSRKNAKEAIWMKIFFMGILLLNVTFQLTLGTRIILYFTMAQIFAFPLFLKYNRDPNHGLPSALILIYSLIIFSKILWASEQYLVPYKLANL